MSNAVLEDYERTRVPAQEGRGYFGLTLVFLGICIAIPSFLLGSALAASMGLKRAIACTFWGCVVATPVCLLASHVGTRTRLSTAMTLKFTFGSAGAKLISAIIAVDMFCWFAVNAEIFGSSLQYTVASILSATLSKPFLAVFAGILMTAVTIFGYRSVEKLAFLSVPLLAAVILTYFISTLTKNPFGEVLRQGSFAEPMSYATGISIVAGTFLSVSVLLPDFTRYSKSARHAAAAVILGLSLGLPPFVLMGSYLTAATRELDFVKVMLLHGWGIAAVLVIALTCWIHMNTDLYCASLNLAAIIPRTPKWKLTAFAGLAGTSVALFGIVSRYVPFLIVLSLVLPPIAGVYTADYWLRRNTYRSAQFQNVSRFQWMALAALAMGVAVGFLTTPRGEMGFGLFRLTYLPAIDSFLASFVSRWALEKVFVPVAQRESETLGKPA